MQRIISAAEILLVVLMLVSGALGGCTVASHHLLRGRAVTAWLFAAYACIGAFFGLVAFLAQHVIATPASLGGQLGISALTGFGGALLLSGINLSARFILRRLGVEIVVQANRIGGDRQPWT